MTTFTATPNTATGAVTLSITQTASVQSITRSNGNGVATVRVATGQLPSATTGTTIVTDYEASHGLNTYTAYLSGTKTNLVGNPSFETDVSGWTLTGVTGSSTASFPQMIKSGTKMAQLSSDGTQTAPSISLLSTAQRPPVTAGKWVGFRAFTATESGGYETRLQLSFRNSSGTTVGTAATSPYVAAPFYDGVTHALVAQAPVGAVSVAAYIQYRDGNATSTLVPVGKRMWVDAVQLVVSEDEADAQRSTQEFFEGTVPLGPVTATATLTIDKPWLLVPISPHFSETVETITDYSAGRETFATVHQIIGRADPLVVMGKLGTRTGTLEFWAESLEDVNRLTRVFDRGEAVMLKQPVPGMDMYLAATSLDVTPYSVEGPDNTRYRFAVSYQEVTRPYGDLAGALGWTFDALAADYASFNAVTAAFATFDDLTLGDAL